MRQKIKDIADIRIGYQFRGKVESDPAGIYRVIQIRDIDESSRFKGDECTAVSPKGDMSRYLVRKNDILFLSRGPRNYAAPITVPLQNTIAASYFFILKIKTDLILPEYLAWYINQSPTQEFLRSHARRGTHMPLVPLSAFSELTIEVPEIKIQRSVIEISRLEMREKELIKTIQAKRSFMIKGMCLRAVKTKGDIK